jgi:hypothetical protein
MRRFGRIGKAVRFLAANAPGPHLRRNTMRRTPVDGLVASGLAQVALGALVGIPYAIATYRPELLDRLGVRAPGRVRQLHLDLVMMGGLVTATGAALPRIPRAVAVPLAVGCWSNALAFAPPAITPSVENSAAFRTMVTASFVTTSVSWVAVAMIALHRWHTSRAVEGGRSRRGH